MTDNNPPRSVVLALIPDSDWSEAKQEQALQGFCNLRKIGVVGTIRRRGDNWVEILDRGRLERNGIDAILSVGSADFGGASFSFDAPTISWTDTRQLPEDAYQSYDDMVGPGGRGAPELIMPAEPAHVNTAPTRGRG